MWPSLTVTHFLHMYWSVVHQEGLEETVGRGGGEESKACWWPCWWPWDSPWYCVGGAHSALLLVSETGHPGYMSVGEKKPRFVQVQPMAPGPASHRHRPCSLGSALSDGLPRAAG